MIVCVFFWELWMAFEHVHCSAILKLLEPRVCSMHLTVLKTYVGLLVNYIQLSYGARMGGSFYTL